MEGAIELLFGIVMLLALCILPLGTLVLLIWSYWHPRPVTNFDVFWIGATIAFLQIFFSRGR